MIAGHPKYLKGRAISDEEVVAEWARMMYRGQPVTMFGSNGVYVTGLLNNIEREDGSGKCWNLTISPCAGGKDITLFIRL